MKSHAAHLFALAAVTLLTLTLPARAQTTPTVITLYSFLGNTTDGANPLAELIQGSDGNFYGTTDAGGSNSDGTVFKVTPAGFPTTLYSFTGGSMDGANPYAGLALGTDGNFYGVTYAGGGGNDGTFFSITAAGVPTPLYSFTDPTADGANPQATLVPFGNGTFYGTTHTGGTDDIGTIFSITQGGVATILYNFTGGADGSYPAAKLVLSNDGNFYGTTTGGSGGVGTFFSITPDGVLTPLHSFNGTDGSYPYGALVQGNDGNFYGTTYKGGANSDGTVFSITPAGVLTTLYSFTGGTDGGFPQAGLAQGNDGMFYGTTSGLDGESTADGTVFSITPAGVLTTLHNFTGSGTDGASPTATLTLGTDGNFYGTTYQGGSNGVGTVFELVLVPPVGMVQFASATYNTTENAGSVTLTVSRVGGSAGAISVDYATSDGTAVTGTDYQATTGTVTWADGDATDKTITIPIVDRQAYDDSTVAFNVGLTNATGGASVGTVPTATVSILDDDTAPQPTVVIASPPDGSTIVAGEVVPFAASVDDPGGILSAVQFTVDGIQLAKEHGEGPFTTNFATSPYPPGDYVVVANATDNQGRTNSSTVTVHLIAATTGSTPPTAALITPFLDATGQPRNLPAGSTVTITFTAASADGAALAKVSLYADGVLVAAFDGSGNPLTMATGRPVRLDAATGVGIVFQTPYTLPGADKIVNLIAVALDALGQTTVSTVASIHSTVTTDNAPLVTLGGVTNGTHIEVGMAVAVNVSASDPDASTAIVLGQGPGRADAEGNATLAELEYFINGVSQGSSLQPPFGFTFSPPAAGQYVLNAVATDGSGLATISDPIIVDADAPTPTINLAASGTGAAVQGVANGVVLVTRTGDTTNALTVSYKVKGTAVAGVDYKKLSGTVTIPAGAVKAKIKVKPLSGAIIAGTLKVKVLLLSSSDGSYVVGTTVPVKIKLIGD